MKHIVENLFEEADRELKEAVIKVENDLGTDDDVIYWAVRVQTLMQILELMNKEEEQMITLKIQ